LNGVEETTMRSKRTITLAYLLIAISGIALLSITGEGKNRASIVITVVPPADAQGGSEKESVIKGKAGGLANCQDCQVVLFARTDQWYVQPLADSPYTSIHDGVWQSETHLGREYAALLVRPSYKPAAILQRLPPVGGNVLAVDIKAGK
jgi:hypothetical protein